MRMLITWVLLLYYAATIRRGSDTPSLYTTEVGHATAWLKPELS